MNSWDMPKTTQPMVTLVLDRRYLRRCGANRDRAVWVSKSRIQFCVCAMNRRASCATSSTTACFCNCIQWNPTAYLAPRRYPCVASDPWPRFSLIRSVSFSTLGFHTAAPSTRPGRKQYSGCRSAGSGFPSSASLHARLCPVAAPAG
ncbi:uncharacterized protein M421DRAFT_177392 [Didymella exigua CBS 183.55]|uniref:Uncharacterized protein n=1 Tax=Didymella exigua CBS 183.55 TaxID=1150837 RepID=A0A6A5RIP9_9PLEO|nr:uncharacterized protein M421DRAFT_177392 [Didymella exigua CBS 183.55]KAF1927343.1 hypothetical protein M421DRAFT_177392 [Didymella exigua CBS 183.55]